MGIYHNYSYDIERIIRNTFYKGRYIFMNADFIDYHPLVAIIFFLANIKDMVSPNLDVYTEICELIDEISCIIGNHRMDENFELFDDSMKEHFGITANNNKEYLISLIRKMDVLSEKYRERKFQ